MKKLFLSLALVALSAGSAQAQYSLLTARGQVGGTGIINWATLGGDYSAVSNPFNIGVSNTSLTATLSMPSGSFERRNQGTGWAGNFDDGDALLWTNNNPGPLKMALNGAVSAAGSNIQRDNYGEFSGVLHALDAMGNSLVSFNFNGESTSRAGTALFVGISSALGNIYGLRWEMGSADFAINSVSVNAGTAVPEPTSMALTALGLFGLGAAARRRRRV